jgi:hypothetical protein
MAACDAALAPTSRWRPRLSMIVFRLRVSLLAGIPRTGSDWWRGKWSKRCCAGYREGSRAGCSEADRVHLICAKEDRFQVYICEGPQITVLVSRSPQENEHEPVETLTEDEPILVVKEHDDDIGSQRLADVLVATTKTVALSVRPDQPNE